MSARVTVLAMRQLVELRSAQTLAAAARTSQLQKALVGGEARLASEREAQEERQAGWSAAAAAFRPDPQLMGAWALALLDGEQTVDSAAKAVRRATERRDDARAETRLAEARQAAAETLARKLGRRARRLADEAAINESEDGHARQRGRP